MILLILLDPLVHLFLNLQLLLLSLFSVKGKVVKSQLALLVLPVTLCYINCVLAYVHALVDVLVEEGYGLEELDFTEVTYDLNVFNLFQLAHCHL
jgi:hypothetical protein